MSHILLPSNIINISTGMNKLLFILIMILSNGLFAQQRMQYTYDACGNRTKREIILLKNSQNQGGGKGQDTLFSQINNIDVQLFPNPTLGIINISVKDTSDSGNYDISVIDQFGHIIFEFQTANSDFEIDLSKYPAGMYSFNLVMKSFTKNWTIIKQ